MHLLLDLFEVVIVNENGHVDLRISFILVLIELNKQFILLFRIVNLGLAYISYHYRWSVLVSWP